MAHELVIAFVLGLLTLLCPSAAEAHPGSRPPPRTPPGRVHPPPPLRPVPGFDPSAAGLLATLIAGSAVLVARRRDGR